MEFGKIRETTKKNIWIQKRESFEEVQKKLIFNLNFEAQGCTPKHNNFLNIVFFSFYTSKADPSPVRKPCTVLLLFSRKPYTIFVQDIKVQSDLAVNSFLYRKSLFVPLFFLYKYRNFVNFVCSFFLG